jgi:hypothetical protein
VSLTIVVRAGTTPAGLDRTLARPQLPQGGLTPKNFPKPR